MSYQIQRRFPAVGDIRIRVPNKKAMIRYDALLLALYDEGRIDILRSIRDRKRTLREVYQAKRVNRLGYLSADMEVFRLLQDAVEDTLPKMGRKPKSRDRYACSFTQLWKHLPDDMTVDDLATYEWPELYDEWPNSAADWNRMRAAVSRFLSVLLDDKYHPFRRAVMKRVPRADEPEGRVPELPVPLFWRIVARVPEHLQQYYVTLAVTGLRKGELIRLREHHLLPLTYEIRVPGTKTKSSAATIAVPEDAWPFVEASVPVAISYDRLYREWKKACRAEGADDITLHDIRHLYGQELAEAGRPEASIQQSLRHATPEMTRRYTKRASKHDDAAVIGTRILGGKPSLTGHSLRIASDG